MRLSLVFIKRKDLDMMQVETSALGYQIAAKYIYIYIKSMFKQNNEAWSFLIAYFWGSLFSPNES